MSTSRSRGRVIYAESDKVLYPIASEEPMRFDSTYYYCIDEFGVLRWTDENGNPLQSFSTVTVSREDANALWVPELDAWVVWEQEA